MVKNGVGAFLRNRYLLLKKFPTFMKAAVSSLCSQTSTTGPYATSVEPSLYL